MVGIGVAFVTDRGEIKVDCKYLLPGEVVRLPDTGEALIVTGYREDGTPVVEWVEE